MKASDICVGDWLNIYNFPNDNPKEDDLFPAMVSAMSVFDPFKEPDDVTVELVIERTKGIASRPLDTCLPIKLTESILVRNGFERSERWHYLTTKVSNIKITIQLGCGGKIDYVRVLEQNEIQPFTTYYLDAVFSNIHYVHQLQHLLRLCGIEKSIIL